jgi:2-haloacid dehalogenase
MRHRPQVIAFDVIETLFPLDPIQARLTEAGLPGELVQVWFARILRDGMALTMTGDFKPFPEVAEAALKGLMAEHGLTAAEEKVERVLNGFGELSPHGDVRPSLDLLRAAGVRAIALTNGSEKTTQKLLAKAGLDPLMERVVSIQAVRQWKPARAVYLQAAQAAGVEVQEMALVAAHAWDCRGAAAAGMTTGWLPRQEKRFPDLFGKPDVKGGTLLEVLQQLLSLPLA